jgi:hypothetical protein
MCAAAAAGFACACMIAGDVPFDSIDQPDDRRPQ